MPLQQIAKQIVTLADRRASTPVLITPPYLSFRASFFIELTRELSHHTSRPIRVDWYRGLPKPTTLLSDQLAAWQVRGINRALRRQPLSACRPATQFTAAFPNVGNRVLQAGGSEPATAMADPRPSTASVHVAATIARPGGKNRDFVIGLADARLPLPLWTTAIWLGSSADEIQRFKAA